MVPDDDGYGNEGYRKAEEQFPPCVAIKTAKPMKKIRLVGIRLSDVTDWLLQLERLWN